MSFKTDELKKAIMRLQSSADWLEKKLDEIDNKGGDRSMSPVYIEQKDKALKMKAEKEYELKVEEENNRPKTFGSGAPMNATDIARLSVGGSLKTSSLDKTALTDEAKKDIIKDVYLKEADDKKRADQLFEKGIIVQRKM